jgi:hypothetical protein
MLLGCAQMPVGVRSGVSRQDLSDRPRRPTRIEVSVTTHEDETDHGQTSPDLNISGSASPTHALF